MTETIPPIRVVGLYRFTPFADPAALRDPLARLCCSLGVKGTLLLASEGINGTIAGPDEAIEAVLAHIAALPGCETFDRRESRAPSMPFHRMKVRLKREIVTMGEPDIDPADPGTYVDPADWNALIDDPDTILIDTRNDYEVQVGSFRGAIDPHTKSFSDFPAWFRDHRDELLAGREVPRIAMFCTGGIRCEKATAFLKAEGLDEVYHLKGGILTYLEQVPAGESRWDGECFVFDERVAVGHGLEPGTHTTCRACRMPLNAEDRAHPDYVEGVACPACHADRTDADRARYAERDRQERLAKARGAMHIGAVRADR
jgi:UPF0176 protein